MNIDIRNKNLKEKLESRGFKLIKGISKDSNLFVYEHNGYHYQTDINEVSRIKAKSTYTATSNMTYHSKLKYLNDITPPEYTAIRILDDGRYRFICEGNEFIINKGEERKIDKLYKSRYKKMDVFLSRAAEIWGDEYTYDNTKTNKLTGKIIVTCKIHGDFVTNISNFLRGHGCSECAYERNGWTLTKFTEACKKNGEGKGCFYAIRLIEENLIKIGITSRDVKFRYKYFSNINYNYEVLLEYFDSPKNIYNIEKNIKRKNRHRKVTPSRVFKGMHEVYNTRIIKNLGNVSNFCFDESK